MDNIDFKGKYASKRKGTILSWEFDRNNVKHIILIQEHVFIKSIMAMFSRTDRRRGQNTILIVRVSPTDI